MSSTGPLISLNDASVRAGSSHILKGVDLVIDRGEAVGVFGSNGAGKTTLLRVLATLHRLSAGSGEVLGADLASDDRFGVRPRIGYIGHVPGLYPELTLQENLEFVARAAGLGADDVTDALSTVGLERAGDRLADRCSHGMQRRTEFARVMMLGCDLLLLDEPHSALDADAIDLVDELVRRTVGAGGAAALVSHDRARVTKVADRSLRIAGGRLS